MTDAAPPAFTLPGLPDELFTHRDTWRQALEFGRDYDDAGPRKWEDELRVFDEVFKALPLPQEPPSVAGLQDLLAKLGLELRVQFTNEHNYGTSAHVALLRAFGVSSLPATLTAGRTAEDVKRMDTLKMLVLRVKNEISVYAAKKVIADTGAVQGLAELIEQGTPEAWAQAERACVAALATPESRSAAKQAGEEWGRGPPR